MLGFLKFFDIKYWLGKCFSGEKIKKGASDVIPFLSGLVNKATVFCYESREKLKDIPGTNYELGLSHMRRGNISDSVMRFRMVVFLLPEHVDARYFLGRCLVLEGDNEGALVQFNKVLEIDKDHVTAKYMIDKLNNSREIKVVPADIIQENYEKFLFDVDVNLEQKKEHLVKTVLHNISDKNPNLVALDLGCGEGINAKLLRERDVLKKVSGVEINKDIAKKVKGKKLGGSLLYDELVVGDIWKFILDNNTKYDLILAVDCFQQFGSVDEFLKRIKSSLKAKGVFGFCLRNNELHADYLLNVEQDVFRHSHKFVQDEVKKLGFKKLQISEFVEDDTEYTVFVYGV